MRELGKEKTRETKARAVEGVVAGTVVVVDGVATFVFGTVTCSSSSSSSSKVRRGG